MTTASRGDHPRQSTSTFGRAARPFTYLGLGAALMYLADPVRGRRRRALARDQLAHAARSAGLITRAAALDVGNRLEGLRATGSRWFRQEASDDEVLVPRIRAELGRVVSHPHGVHVSAHDGHVVLDGPILSKEVAPLLTAVKRLRGVRNIQNRLQVFDSPGKIPALQGGRERRGKRLELFQDVWSPALRVLAGTAGPALIYRALRQGGPFGIVLGALGMGLLLRGATNRNLASLVGVGKGRRPIDVHKTININAPVSTVFGFWANPENFPHFMLRVREVRPLGDNRWHWTVAGPGGINVEWSSERTNVVPDKLIEWRTSEDSKVQHAGAVRFDPADQGGTRVIIKLQYVPLAGDIGHAVARLFGADPKSDMDADLARMKTMIETGRAPHAAAEREATPRGARSEQWRVAGDEEFMQ